MRVSDLRLLKLAAIPLIAACAGCGGADSASFENVGSSLDGGGAASPFDASPADMVAIESPNKIEPEWPGVTADEFDDTDVLLNDLDDMDLPEVAPPLEASEPPSGGGGGGGGGFIGVYPFRVPPHSTLPDLSLGTDLPMLPVPITLPDFNAGAAAPPVASASPQKETSTSADDARPEEESAASVSQVDKIVKTLPYGEVVYNAPEKMQYGEPTDLELLLSPTESAEELRTQMRNPNNARSASLQIGNRMEARLSGDGFAIEALSPALQAVTSTRATRWRWRVTPISHGLQELNLSLLAHIDVAGNDAPLVVETKDALIQVEITFSQRLAGFIEPNWQWLWGTVLFPIVGYRLRRRRRMDYYEPRRTAA